MNWKLTSKEKQAIKDLYAFIEEEERLSPTGSGAMTCCGGRGAGDQQGSVEEEGAKRLNREDWRVAPGEAKSALLELMDRWQTREHQQREIMLEFKKSSNHRAAEIWRRVADTVADCRRELLMVLLTKPDSVALKERSGRRNSELNP